MHARPEDDPAAPVDAEPLRALGSDPSPLAVLEGTEPLPEMDREQIGTPLGDLDALSPR